MSVTVNEQTILDALHQLSRDRWGDVLAFIKSLRPVDEPAQEIEKRPLTASDLLASGLVGLWLERSDIGDSAEYAAMIRAALPARDRR